MAAAVEMTERGDAAPVLLALRDDGTSTPQDDCASSLVVLAVARAVKAALESTPVVRNGKRVRQGAPELPEQTRKRATMERRVALSSGQHEKMAQFLLRRQEFHALQATAAAEPVSESVCAICLEELRGDASVSLHKMLDTLPCGHVYHRRCIDRWSTYNRCCPIDRSAFE